MKIPLRNISGTICPYKALRGILRPPYQDPRGVLGALRDTPSKIDKARADVTDEHQYYSVDHIMIGEEMPNIAVRTRAG
jgi:hypothetical protein